MKKLKIFIGLVMLSCLVLSQLFPLSADAKDVRTIKLNQNMVAKVYVSPGRSTVLSFPTKPSKVILGNQGVFAVEYVDSDLAVAALSMKSQSDLFVYLDGRRFAFDLVSVQSGGDTIVLVRDAIDEPDSPQAQPSKASQTNRKKNRGPKQFKFSEVVHE